MEVQFLMTVTCDVSEIEGCGIDEQICRVSKALCDCSLRDIAAVVMAYRIDNVMEIARRKLDG